MQVPALHVSHCLSSAFLRVVYFLPFCVHVILFCSCTLLLPFEISALCTSFIGPSRHQSSAIHQPCLGAIDHTYLSTSLHGTRRSTRQHKCTCTSPQQATPEEPRQCIPDRCQDRHSPPHLNHTAQAQGHPDSQQSFRRATESFPRPSISALLASYIAILCFFFFFLEISVSILSHLHPTCILTFASPTSTTTMLTCCVV